MHDSYFVVAHFHYVLFGGAMFAILGGLIYWWPKMFGRLLSERLCKWVFWLVFAGFNLAFFPQHMLGLLGMPRRVFTYRDDALWEGYNLASTIGSYVMGLRPPALPVGDRQERATGAGPATTRGSATRSSGTRPRRRRRTTSTRCRT